MRLDLPQLVEHALEASTAHEHVAPEQCLYFAERSKLAAVLTKDNPCLFHWSSMDSSAWESTQGRLTAFRPNRVCASLYQSYFTNFCCVARVRATAASTPASTSAAMYSAW